MDGHSNHGKAHSHRHSSAEHMQAEIDAANAAWTAWKSDDPAAWDRAIDEKNRIVKKDPTAWRQAMHEVDAEEAKAKKLAQVTPPPEKQAIRHEQNTGQAGARTRLQDEYLEGSRRQPKAETGQPAVPLHPGYAPQNQFAPPSPNSPAYDAAYNQPPPEFYGLNLGVIKLGVNSNGSLDVGVNIGIARAEVQAGLENRVDGEFMPIGGPLHARAGAGIGVSSDGIHSEVGAGANFFNLVNGDADFGARLGKNTGVNGDVRGKVWPVDVQADAGAGVGPDGVNAYAGANTNVADAAGVRAGGRFALGRDSGVAAGVGVRAGDKALDFGPSVDTYGDHTVKPNVHLDPVDQKQATFYPTGDRQRDS